MFTEEQVLNVVKEQRDAMGGNDKKRDKGLKVPAGLKCFYDIRYSKDGDECLLDLYKPARASKKTAPVIVSVHGGGWIYGDKELYRFYCMELARRGFAVANFTYRLAPENKFPSALIDTNNVFKWILKNAAAYGLDIKNIFATGDSAGANYLSLYAAIMTNKKFAENFSFKTPARLNLKGLYLNCGFYDWIKGANTNKETLALLQALMPYGGTEREKALASPALHVTKDFPPSFIVTAEFDFLRPMAALAVQSLCAAGVDFRYKCYFSAKEKLFHVFMLNLRSKEGKKSIDEQCDWFKTLS
ncbi:MAG: alpha/beta hydrolase [Treponema sp.]|nr:alpha/beta hydrolase [Treponema sp.]